MKKADLVKALKNKTQLMNAMKELNLKELEGVHARMTDVFESLINDKKKEEELALQRREKAKQIFKRAEDEGLDVIDLLEAAGLGRAEILKDLKKDVKHKKAVKYRFGDHEWSGAGRPPKWATELKSQGVDIEKYRVDKD